MSHYIVLVKQVPDVTQITDNAFDPETGNLMRGRLASVINELDAQALAFAWQMRQTDPGVKGKIIALTMGPPMAGEVLRYSLSRGADLAVLLTDRVLGGADTWATANPLAFAIRRIVREILGGTGDYLVVTGMQSVDGDTAQVPAQVAEELNIPCIAYATSAQPQNRHFEFTRIISGGSQVVAPKRLPAVITVAKYEFPLFATVAATRCANAAQVIQYSADDVKPTAVGVQGSKTRVIRVFPPEKTHRRCHLIKDINELAQTIIDNYKPSKGHDQAAQGANNRYVLPTERADKFDRHFEGTQKECHAYQDLARQLKSLGIKDVSEIDDPVKEKILAAAGKALHPKALDEMLDGLQASKPAYHGEVWVVAEHNGSDVFAASFELIGKARELADSLGTRVGVAIAGHKVGPMAQSLIAAGADNVYIIEDERLAQFDPTAHRKAIADVIAKYWPQIVLFAATPQGRVLAPMVSYRLGCGLTADCTSFDIRDNSRKGEIAILLQTRPALGGNVMATISTKSSRCQMATARPGVMKRLPMDNRRQGLVIPHQVELNPDDFSLDIIRTELGHGHVKFDSDIIVSGGKGLQSKAGYDKLVAGLCDAICTKLSATVERGASRAAVEQGFIDRVHQVGQTGTAVGPKIYMALGISGAIQHMIGVANSQTIIAVNNDPHAPILNQCDYYMIGNVETIIPQLTQILGAR